MNTADRILVVGLGSPHGDDQAGWMAIDRLQTKPLRGVQLVRLALPHDLLDRLDRIDALHVIDAAESSEGQFTSLCVRFEATNISEGVALSWQSTNYYNHDAAIANLVRPKGLRSAGSHQVDVLTVLDLAACLRQLPQRVVLWTIPGSRFESITGVSKECARMIDRCVAAMLANLG